MPIKKTEINESDEQRTEREKQEQEQQKQNEEREQARQTELENIREEARKADIARAKAEGEAEALRRGATQTQQPWTDEQWEAEGQKRGMTGQQFRATAELAGGIAQHATGQIREELAAVRKELAESRQETGRLKAGKGKQDAQETFFEKNPALRGHRKEVDEFLATYPDADTVDAATLQKRLAIAGDLVKGKVRETMRTTKAGETGSTRFEETEQETEIAPEEIREFDPKGTGNEGAAHLMSRVNASFGTGLRHPDSIDVWKKSLDEEGRGVSVSMDEDIERARKLQNRDVLGGKRGEA